MNKRVICFILLFIIQFNIIIQADDYDDYYDYIQSKINNELQKDDDIKIDSEISADEELQEDYQVNNDIQIYDELQFEKFSKMGIQTFSFAPTSAITFPMLDNFGSEFLLQNVFSTQFSNSLSLQGMLDGDYTLPTQSNYSYSDMISNLTTQFSKKYNQSALKVQKDIAKMGLDVMSEKFKIGVEELKEFAQSLYNDLPFVEKAKFQVAVEEKKVGTKVIPSSFTWYHQLGATEQSVVDDFSQQESDRLLQLKIQTAQQQKVVKDVVTKSYNMVADSRYNYIDFSLSEIISDKGVNLLDNLNYNYKFAKKDYASNNYFKSVIRNELSNYIKLLLTNNIYTFQFVTTYSYSDIPNNNISNANYNDVISPLKVLLLVEGDYYDNRFFTERNNFFISGNSFPLEHSSRSKYYSRDYYHYRYDLKEESLLYFHGYLPTASSGNSGIGEKLTIVSTDRLGITAYENQTVIDVDTYVLNPDNLLERMKNPVIPIPLDGSVSIPVGANELLDTVDTSNPNSLREYLERQFPSSFLWDLLNSTTQELTLVPETDIPHEEDKEINIPILSDILRILQDILDWLKNMFNVSNFSLDFSGFKNLVVMKKFPFSIPFDLVNAIRIFAKQSKDFVFKIDLNTQYFKLNHTIDLSHISFFIGFFRYVCCAWFIFFLTLKTKDLIKF